MRAWRGQRVICMAHLVAVRETGPAQWPLGAAAPPLVPPRLWERRAQSRRSVCVRCDRSREGGL